MHKYLIYNINQTLMKTLIRHIILIVFDCKTNSNRSLIKILMSDNSELARLNSFKNINV